MIISTPPVDLPSMDIASCKEDFAPSLNRL